MRRIVMTMVVLVSIVTLGGCGDDGDGTPPTTVATEPATTITTIAQGDAQGIACLNLATEALKLKNDFRLESRGIVAPDEDAYRAEAAALRAEHARLGCPGELLRGFLDY